MLAALPYHWLDPVLIPIYGNFGIRWYGLSYLVGFCLAIWILRRLSRAGYLPLKEEQVMDFLGWLVLGVILGGRVGYVFFYQPELLETPWKLIKIWEGGLSFHGGLLGVALATTIYARRQSCSFFRIGDGLALAVTPGIFCVRMANFINGELFGRVAGPGVPWAMPFPHDKMVPELLHKEGFEIARGLDPGALGARLREAYEQGVWDRIVDRVPLRHPSQVYEALSEGLLLGLILLAVYVWDRRRGFRLPRGGLVAIFLGGYGLFRFGIEFFRQPDAQFEGRLLFGLFSRGQELCFLMMAAAVALFLWCARRDRAR